MGIKKANGLFFCGCDFLGDGQSNRENKNIQQFEEAKRRATYLFLPSRLWLFCRAERRRWYWPCSSDTRAVCSLIISLVLRWCFRTSSFISLYCFLCSRTKPFCCFNSSTVWASSSKGRDGGPAGKGDKREREKGWWIYCQTCFKCQRDRVYTAFSNCSEAEVIGSYRICIRVIIITAIIPESWALTHMRALSYFEYIYRIDLLMSVGKKHCQFWLKKSIHLQFFHTVSSY